MWGENRQEFILGTPWHFKALNEITSYPRLRLELVLAEKRPISSRA